MQDDTAVVVVLVAEPARDTLDLLNHPVRALGAGVGDPQRPKRLDDRPPRRDGLDEPGRGALWQNKAWWFGTGRQTRKGRNLDRDPRCTLAVALHEFDLVVYGTAEVITDRTTVATMAERWAAEGWPCRVDESGIALTADFSAPSAGKPPWHVYRISPLSATALATVEPGGATRWRW